MAVGTPRSWPERRTRTRYGGPVQPLRWERRPDGLRAPALVCAFKGWNDAGEAATSALTYMGASLEARRFATIDPEEFVDFQATRPDVKLVDGLSRRIEWPEWEIYEARVPRAPRDLVLLSGPEPSHRWRTFSGMVTELAEALGVQLVVTLGALLADVPHSRPVSVTGLASDAALIERLGLQAPTYEGPTGIVGVLHAACADAGLPSASLWAAVPHYVAVAPNPKGALALLRRLESLVGVTVDAQQLETAAVDYERQVSRAVELDPEVQAFVERLERAADEEEGPPDPAQLPSGDVLAREFQRFLRQRGDR
jgi:proteasome assembly chaperone (PAC2) family protein